MDGTTRGLFETLDATGHFFRDNAIGRIFHPGALSFREICDNESLHVAVRPGNRVSVHVDRVSPLRVRTDGRCRYSVARAVRHVLAGAVESVAGLVLRRPPRPRCQLDCEVVWVPDDDLATGPAAEPVTEGAAAEAAVASGVMSARPLPPARPRALTTSAALGVVGLVLLVTGFVSGSSAIYLASGVAAALSLISALVWRSQLVEAWHAERKRR